MTRRGHTLIELLITISVGTVVVGLAALIAFRHQRFHRDLVVAVERSEQLDQLVALMPIAIRSVAPGEGDIAPGSARDTSLEFRATIVSAVACDSGGTTVLVAPAGALPRLASVLARPEPGDTAWFLDASAANETWTPRPVTSVIDSLAVCVLGGILPFGTESRSSLAIRLAEPPPFDASVVSVTRPWRYSLYRGSDGAWYLGAKDWNTALARFNSIQPVAGPLMSASKAGLRFRYYDSLGATVAATDDPRRIALVEVAFRVDSAIPGQYVHATSIRGRASALIALRNRGR